MEETAKLIMQYAYEHNMSVENALKYIKEELTKKDK